MIFWGANIFEIINKIRYFNCFNFLNSFNYLNPRFLVCPNLIKLMTLILSLILKKKQNFNNESNEDILADILLILDVFGSDTSTHGG